MVNIQDTDAKIDFRIVGNTSHYMDLFGHFCMIVAQDGSDIKAPENISTVNLFMHSLFSNCKV